MFGPTRLAYALRPHAPGAIIAAAAAVAIMFVSTPFLLPEIAARFGVTVGVAGRMSVAQVGGFALTTLALPRLVAPSGRVLRLGGAALVVANLVSILVPTFPLFLAVRFVAGVAGGTLTWLAWGDAMRSPRTLTSVASVGPVAALVASPLMSAVAGVGGAAIWLLLAATALPSVLLGFEPEGEVAQPGAVSRSRSNRVLLVALFVVTLSGTSLFIFAAVAAADVHGLSPFAASIGYSLNAAAGILGARLAHRHRRPGWWFASVGIAAFLTVGGGTALFFVGMAWWGFGWWMGLPGVLRMLTERSLLPDERAGHAQGLMAVGRAIGPLVGGHFADSGAWTTLAIVAGSGLALGGGSIVAVDEGRDRLPPSDPRVFAG